MIPDNIGRVWERIEEACRRAGRKKEEIQVVAVTKTVPVEKIIDAVGCGLLDLGENRVQEAKDKFQTLRAGNPSIRWHLIGRLQSNKVNRAVEIFDLIQSLDSERLATAIDRRARELNKIQECLVEVKVSGEPSKTGCLPEHLNPLLEACDALKNVRLKGLMCIAPYFEDARKARPYFATARQLFETHFGGSRVVRPILSMGMSHDFEAAIGEGSTMLRVGTAIFGARKGADHVAQ